MYKYLLIAMIAAATISCEKNDNDDGSNKATGDLVATFNRGQANNLEQAMDQFPFWDCDTSTIACTERGLECDLMQAKVFVTIYQASVAVDTYYVVKNEPVTFAGLAVGSYELAAIAYAPYEIADSNSGLFQIAFACETQLESFQITGGQTTTLVLDTIWND